LLSRKETDGHAAPTGTRLEGRVRRDDARLRAEPELSLEPKDAPGRVPADPVSQDCAAGRARNAQWREGSHRCNPTEQALRWRAALAEPGFRIEPQPSNGVPVRGEAPMAFRVGDRSVNLN
jgi:hypothetical protein